MEPWMLGAIYGAGVPLAAVVAAMVDDVGFEDDSPALTGLIAVMWPIAVAVFVPIIILAAIGAFGRWVVNRLG